MPNPTAQFACSSANWLRQAYRAKGVNPPCPCTRCACSEAQDPLAAASELMPEAAALYRSAGDLSLKEGETIK